MRRKHIKDIHTKIKNDNELVNKMICPKCGNQLVKKTGKYGTFIGCSNFPKCKYTKKLIININDIYNNIIIIY